MTTLQVFEEALTGETCDKVNSTKTKGCRFKTRIPVAEDETLGCAVAHVWKVEVQMTSHVHTGKVSQFGE